MNKSVKRITDLCKKPNQTNPKQNKKRTNKPKQKQKQKRDFQAEN